ncbi:hypothetical protein ACFX2I_043155 [Malus domestica]|uniref:Transmembrane protein n=1 Tax=Malus baccata TaxID=106549 RepID=A0A540MKE2_MALBA|nr:hypothetical protein C1H46_015165 [Malus baccata]
MAKSLKPLFSFLVAVLVVSSLVLCTSEARSLKLANIDKEMENVFDGLYIGTMKEGPSDGRGHAFTESETLGGNKSGPSSSGEGH